MLRSHLKLPFTLLKSPALRQSPIHCYNPCRGYSIFRRPVLSYTPTRARKKSKAVEVMSTSEIIRKAKNATEWYKYVLHDEEAIDPKDYKETRVRYAPSPTGEMHIGGLRTALFNYLFAKSNNGTFILRIEDTDKAREVPGSDRRIVEILKWAGLKWDEGVGVREMTDTDDGSIGDFGPYYQSKRLDIYKKWVHTLLENKQAYH